MEFTDIDNCFLIFFPQKNEACFEQYATPGGNIYCTGSILFSKALDMRLAFVRRNIGSR